MRRHLKTVLRVLRPTWSEWLVVAVALLIVTGLILTPTFDASNGRSAIASWLLAQPVLAWVRSVHFWAASVAVLGFLMQVVVVVSDPGTGRRRIGVTLPAAGGVLAVSYGLVSGLLLRADPSTEPLRAWLRDCGNRVPPAGGVLGTLLWGQAGGANVMYFQHIATAVILLLLVVGFRARLRPVHVGGCLTTAAAIIALSAVCSPGLYDGPIAAVGAGPHVVALRSGPLLHLRSGRANLRSVKLPPTVRGRPEGCLGCHVNLSGLGEWHDPRQIGCVACHGGDSFSLERERAHAGMVLVPGNLADAPRTCGQAGCHESVVPRIERSIMSTMAGVIAIDRELFGEAGAAGSPPHIRDLGASPADTHLRQLCASCHLGQPKTVWGPINDGSRGGGCSACHLTYSPDARTQLTTYGTVRAPGRTAVTASQAGQLSSVPTVHPALTANPPSGNCFGCHSRSSRISTNYEGWLETDAAAKRSSPDLSNPPPERRLKDGRVLARVTPDVHQERGLECVDCHGAAEVMGKDMVVQRKHEQSRLQCEDCHALRLATTDPVFADPETEKLLALRRVTLAPTQRLATTRSGDPMVNVVVNANGQAALLGKRTGERHAMKAPGPACAAGKGHARLSCESCHTAWAPRCISCHTSFDARAEAFDHVAQTWTTGAWQEEGAGAEAVPPTLGVRESTADPAHPRGIIETFIPGMIIDLDRNRTPGRPADATFRRLYARTAAHTTRRAARSCGSCHADPIALGFGEGTLRYATSGNVGHWEFVPKHAIAPQDGLPIDAWTGFLRTRTDCVSTRDDVRPFTADEQKRILTIGACLTCHEPTSGVMRDAIDGLDAVLNRRRAACIVPTWPK